MHFVFMFLIKLCAYIEVIILCLCADAWYEFANKVTKELIARNRLELHSNSAEMHIKGSNLMRSHLCEY